VLIVVLLVSCSKLTNEQIAANKIEASLWEKWSKNLVSLSIVSGYGNPIKALEWSQSIENENISRIKQMDALANAGLLKAGVEGAATRYSLTQKGWSHLTPWNPWIRFYIGHYEVDVIKSFQPLDIEPVLGEEIYIVEASLKVTDIQEWVNAPGVKESFPKIAQLLQGQTKKYIFFKGPTDKKGWRQVVNNIRQQLKAKADPSLRWRTTPVLSLDEPDFKYEGRKGEHIKKSEAAASPTDSELQAGVKENVSRWAKPEAVQFLSFNRYDFDVYPFTTFSFSLVSDSSEEYGQLTYCYGDQRFDRVERKVRGSASCSSFSSDPLGEHNMTKVGTTLVEKVESDSRGEKTWRKRFVKDEKEIPKDVFKAFYFDERKAGIVNFSEIVKIPSIHYARGDFHGIKADNIGAYYIGRFLFNKETTKILNLFQGNAESAIFINGKKVWQGGSYSHQDGFTFSPGEHLIEIQYVSKYSAAGFLFTMTDGVGKSVDELSQQFKDSGGVDVWYCGTYESDNFDGTIDVILENNDKPLILILSSFEPVVWKIGNNANRNLKAIIVSSEKPGSKVVQLDSAATVTRAKRMKWIYDIYNTSSSNSRNTFKNLIYDIQSIFNKKPVGFSGEYSLKSVSIPEKILDANLYESIGLNMHSKQAANPNKKKSKLDKVFE
jgi:hypothetical protein